MRPFPQKLLRLTLAGIASISTAGGLSAQDAVPPRSGGASAPAVTSEAGRKSSSEARDANLGAKAQREADARHRRWDRKMKAVSGSVCRGC